MSGDGDEVLYAELAGDLRRRSHRAFERIFKEMGPRLPATRCRPRCPHRTRRESRATARC